MSAIAMSPSAPSSRAAEERRRAEFAQPPAALNTNTPGAVGAPRATPDVDAASAINETRGRAGQAMLGRQDKPSEPAMPKTPSSSSSPSSSDPSSPDAPDLYGAGMLELEGLELDGGFSATPATSPMSQALAPTSPTETAPTAASTPTDAAKKAKPVLGLGARGPEVRALQEKLNTKGDAGLTVDGIFGDQTERAVKSFQRDAGIADDGIAGFVTHSALER